MSPAAGTLISIIDDVMTQPSHKRPSHTNMEDGPPSKMEKPLVHLRDETLLNKIPPTITLMVGECEVKRLSVDNRCLRNILFVSTLEKMHQEWDRMDKPTEFVSLPDNTIHLVVGKIILAVVPTKW